MSKFTKTILAIGLVGSIAACAQQEEEFVVVEPEAITTEPVQSGKY